MDNSCIEEVRMLKMSFYLNFTTVTQLKLEIIYEFFEWYLYRKKNL